MDKGKKYGIVAAVIVIIIIVAAGAWFLSQDNGGNDTVKGDTYYVYLDGMGDVDGWYSGVGDNPNEGICNALDGNVEYSINTDGWISSINGLVGSGGMDGGEGFGVFAFGSTTFEYANSTYFGLTGVINDIPSNIAYISFGPYTFENNMMVYDVNPMACEDLMSTGPFDDENYKPLEYSGTFYVYLNGFGDVDGWYSGTGSNQMEGISAALSGIDCEIDAGGWIKSIDGAIPGVDGKYIGTYEYISTNMGYFDASYFLTGPTLNSVTSNVIYVCYSGYTIDENYVTTYDLNPMVSTVWQAAEGSPFTA